MNNTTELMNRLLSSQVKAELLILFHKNPGLIDTLDGVTRRIGRTGKTVETELRDLVDLGILKTKTVGRFEVFLFDRAKDKEIQETIADYLRSKS